MTTVNLNNGYYNFALQRNCKVNSSLQNNLAKNATNPITSNAVNSANISFGSKQEKSTKRLIKEINAIEQEYEAKYPALFDESTPVEEKEKLKKELSKELRQKTAEFQERLKGKEKIEEQEELEKILPEAYAMTKIAVRAVFGYKEVHDVQLMGAIAMHRGEIAEMQTGEGKTLTATFPAYLNALTGKGVHVITVNDYLAQRDAEKMGKIYSFLGLKSKCVLGEMTTEEKQEAYGADITYGMNSTFAFDFLEDNRATDEAQQVQRPFNFAIIDEADSVLIDEAATPYIKSAASNTSEDTANWRVCAELAEEMEEGEDYEADYETETIMLLGTGETKLEKKLLELKLNNKNSKYSEENKSNIREMISILDEEIPIRQELEQYYYKMKELKANKLENRSEIKSLKEKIKELEDKISTLEDKKAEFGKGIKYLGIWGEHAPKKDDKDEANLSRDALYTHYMTQVLRAKEFFEKDREYAVTEGKETPAELLDIAKAQKQNLELKLNDDNGIRKKLTIKNMISILDKEISLRKKLLEDCCAINGFKGSKDEKEQLEEEIEGIEEKLSTLESKKEKFGKEISDFGPKKGKIEIIDKFTGRSLNGRQWSEGLHQAIEAKENLLVHPENTTVSSVASYDFYKRYKKLCGMTGTASASEKEFNNIYGIGIESIPTNEASKRIDFEDALYKTKDEKYKAVIEEVKKCIKLGRPVLIGTTDVEDSEYLSELLKKENIEHNVLNAKNNAEEAEIVKKAGQKGAVTVATNMAGRGTDIILSDEVKEAGGLHVIGTERHESKRIDEQLRGRAARQGDPGSSQFILSLEDEIIDPYKADELLELAAGKEQVQKDEDTTILGNTIQEGKITSKKIIKMHKDVQTEIESSKSAQREKTIKREEILNDQKRILYQERQKILKSKSKKDIVNVCVRNLVHNYMTNALSLEGLKELIEKLNETLSIKLNAKDFTKLSSKKELEDKLTEEITKNMKTGNIQAIKRNALRLYDIRIKGFLDSTDDIFDNVKLRVYAQKNVDIEYVKVAHEIFDEARVDLFTTILQRI